MHPLHHGKYKRSFGDSFVYQIQGPCCRVYDKEELPWPSCSLQWKGKQPSWNRVGSRFVADLACTRHPSYAVAGWDNYGSEWFSVITFFEEKLTVAEKKWWVWKGPQHLDPPATVDEMEHRLASGHQW
jgi:hypothetical protein